jgi:hypothetical protein
MFKYLASILFLLLSVPAFCQKKNTRVIVETIKATNRISKEVYIFPKVIVPNNKLASTKINKTLLAFLDVEKDSVKKSIFENVWEPKNENCAWLYPRYRMSNQCFVRTRCSRAVCDAWLRLDD